MDCTNEDWISPDEVPSFLLNLTDRIEILKQAACLFRGWDSEIEELKSSSISAFMNCKRGIEEMKKYGKALVEELEASNVSSTPGVHLHRLSTCCSCCNLNFFISGKTERFNAT